MTKGAQAHPGTVSFFQMRLESLCDEAKDSGVVLRVDIKSLTPYAQGHIEMVPSATAAWKNAETSPQPAVAHQE